MNALRLFPGLVRALFAAAVLTLAAAPRLAAQSLIPFQGRLTDQQGVPYTNGQFTIFFQLYDQAVGGNPIWQERHEKVGVINGMVNVFLGSISSLSGVSFANTKHLGITVDADNNPNTLDPEMVPRQMIIPAFWAKNSDKLSGYDWTPLFGSNNPNGTISGGKITAGSISNSHLAVNAVGSSQLQAGAVTTDKLSTEVYNQLGSGGGRSSGGINYVTSGVGDSTNGWFRYKNPAQPSPTTGSGSISNVTINWERGTNGYLRQGNEFILTVPGGASRQGEGVSTDFTIDAADQTRTLTISYDAMVVSTGYREGDLRLYIIAAPDTTNAMVIEPVPTPVPAGAVGLPFQGRATFQALNGVTRYRLCLHAASTSTSGYLMAFDTFSVGPQAIQSTTPVTDWVPYTCTLTASAIPAASVSAFYRRVGDSVECRVETRNFTSYGSGVYSWSLPPGLKVDLSKGVSLAAGLTDTWNAWGGDTGSSIGAGAATVITSPFKSELQVFAATETTVIAAIPVQSSTATVNVDLLDIIGSSNSGGPFSRISFTFKVPVLGWSSSVQMSSDAGDGRVVAATYYLSANQSTVSQINFDTKLTDTHNAVTTGVGIWKFTAPVPGIYLFSIGVQKDAGTGTIVVYKNNSSFRTALVFDANFKTAVSQIELAAGDFIDFRPSPLSIIIGGPPSSVNAAFFNISRVSSSSAIAGTETVAASYWLTANQAITAQSTTINYDAREFDTHGAVTTGASWSFVAPVAGTYHIGGMMTASGPCNCVLYKNGLIYKYVGAQASGASTANSSLIKLNAGDSISFRGNTSVTVTGAAALSLNPSHISIMRVGN